MAVTKLSSPVRRPSPRINTKCSPLGLTKFEKRKNLAVDLPRDKVTAPHPAFVIRDPAHRGPMRVPAEYATLNKPYYKMGIKFLGQSDIDRLYGKSKRID